MKRFEDQLQSRVRPLQDLSFEPGEITRNIRVLKSFIKETGEGNLSMLQSAKEKSAQSSQLEPQVPAKETTLEETPIAMKFDLGPKSQIDLSATEEFKFMTGIYKHKPSQNRRRREMQQAAQIRNRINKIQSKKHKVKVHNTDNKGNSTLTQKKKKISGPRSSLQLAKKLDAIHAKHSTGPKSHTKRRGGDRHYAQATSCSLEHLAHAEQERSQMELQKAREAPLARKKAVPRHTGADHDLELEWQRQPRKKSEKKKKPHPVFDKALKMMHPKLTSKASRTRHEHELKGLLRDKFLSHKDSSFFLRNLDLCFAGQKAKERKVRRRGTSHQAGPHSRNGLEGGRPETANTAYIKGCNKAHLVPIPLSFAGETLELASVPMRYVPALAMGLRVCTIPNISFRCNDMTDKMARGIIPHLNNEHLRDLDLGRNRIGISGMKSLVNKLPDIQNLMQLCLEANGLSSASIAGLCRCLTPGGAQRLPHLLHLDLSRNKICNVGAKALGDMLWSNTKLLTLWLQWNDIPCNGILFLAEALIHNTALLDLDVSWNSNGSLEEAYQVLGEALRVNKTLRILKLENIPICYNGVVALCEGLKMNKHLCSLHLKEHLATVDSNGEISAQDPDNRAMPHSIFNRIMNIPGIQNSPLWEGVPDCWIKSMWRRISFAWTESSIGAGEPPHLLNMSNKIELVCSFNQWEPKAMGSRSASFQRGSSVTLLVPTKRFQYAYCIDDARVVHAEDQPSHNSLVLYDALTTHAAAAANRAIQPPRPTGISECMANYLSDEYAVAAAEEPALYQLTDDEASYRYQSQMRAQRQRKRGHHQPPAPVVPKAKLKAQPPSPTSRVRHMTRIIKELPSVVNVMPEQKQALKTWEWWHMLLRQNEDKHARKPEIEHVGGWPLFTQKNRFPKWFKGMWSKVHWHHQPDPDRAEGKKPALKSANTFDYPDASQRKQVQGVLNREMVAVNDIFCNLVAHSWVDSHPFCVGSQSVTRFFKKVELWDPEALIVLRYLTEGGQVANGERSPKRRKVVSQNLFLEIFAHLLVHKTGQREDVISIDRAFQEAMSKCKATPQPSAFARSNRLRCVRVHEVLEARSNFLHKVFENWSSRKPLLQLNEFMALFKHYKVFELGSEGDEHDVARRVEQARNAFASARAVDNCCLTFIEFLEALCRYVFLRQPFLHSQEEEQAQQDRNILIDLKIVIDLLCQRHKNVRIMKSQY